MRNVLKGNDIVSDDKPIDQMVPKHTPGPWWIEDRIEVWINAGRTHVATIPRAFDGDWSRANARLIAAAPDMLGALQAFNRAWECEDSTEYSALINSANNLMTDAIAKATGEA